MAGNNGHEPEWIEPYLRELARCGEDIVSAQLVDITVRNINLYAVGHPDFRARREAARQVYRKALATIKQRERARIAAMREDVI